MGRTGIIVLGLSLGLFTLGTIVWYRNAPGVLLAGLLYLLVANGLSLVASLRFRREEPFRALALALASWQLAAIGMLNIWSFAYPEPQGFALSYSAAGIAIAVAYSTVALADSSEQEGGYVPVMYFGRPRSRRLLLCGFIYTPIGLLVMADVLVWATWPRKPMPFQPPRLCLMLVALISVMVFGMVYHRYRDSSPNKRLLNQIAVLTFFGLICVAGVQLILGYSGYNFYLSAIAVVCIAATIYWLSLAGCAITFSGEHYGSSSVATR